MLFDGLNIVNIGLFPAEGLALAFALYFGKRVTIGIFIGQLILALNNNIAFAPSLGVAFINSIEAIIGIMLFQRFKLDIRFKSFRDIAGLVLIVVFVLQIFSAFLSNTVLLLSSQIEKDMFLNSTFSWWFGNIMGQLLFTPFMLSLFINYKKIDFSKYLSYGLAYGVYIYFIEIILAFTSQLLLLTLSIPIVIFVISKEGISFGMLFSVVVALIASYSVYLGTGAFSLESSIDNVINYNLFILTHISIVFTASILFWQRKEFEIELQKEIEKEIRKNKEHQLLMIQQNRLAQMGEMIAMIAHQWRQPLNNLALANQLLISKYKKNRLDDKTVDYFRVNSKRQIDLMSTTIDDFRNFFKSEKDKQSFCVNSVIKNILDMTQAMYATDKIKINFQEIESYFSYGHPNALGQAILNIINNAKDALVDSDIEEKSIDISIEKVNKEIVISIVDNAGGIPQEIMDKIFDPYFTTKDSKNGTGLGLYMTKMIIQDKFNAKITVANRDIGANFKIFLREDKASVK
jgi:signal transduction histidine kinase